MNAKVKPSAPAASKPASTPSPGPGQQVAVPGTKAVALPSYIKQGENRGSENVGMSDVVIPRIEIVQMLSPCLKPNDAAYIEGARPGMLYNSVTRVLYGESADVVPVVFKKEYLCWKDRKKGGGFGGAYPTAQEAALRIKEEPENERESWEAMETAQQLVLVIRDDGSTEEAVVSMARTKMKVSKQWNSLIRINENDRFSRVYKLFTVDEQNNNGDDYKNYAVANLGFTPEDVYYKAEALYKAIASGSRKVNLDHGDEGGEPIGGGSGEY
jgi:hypothetical protein